MCSEYNPDPLNGGLDDDDDCDAEDEDEPSGVFVAALLNIEAAMSSAEVLPGELGATFCGRVLRNYDAKGYH